MIIRSGDKADDWGTFMHFRSLFLRSKKLQFWFFFFFYWGLLLLLEDNDDDNGTGICVKKNLKRKTHTYGFSSPLRLLSIGFFDFLFQIKVLYLLLLHRKILLASSFVYLGKRLLFTCGRDGVRGVQGDQYPP